MKRPSKGEYLMGIAFAVAKRSTCPDMSVGCVLATKDGHILSTGYNGSPAGEKHCRSKGGKCLGNGPKHRVVHSEQNAVAQAAREGIRLEGCVAYVTETPCQKCEMLLKQAGIKRIEIAK